MFPSKTKMCHRTGFEKSCFELCASQACQDRWVHIQGTNAQTGEPIDKWGCVDDHVVTLQLDQTRKLYGLQAAIESMRNEVTKLQVEQIARQERQHREALALPEMIAQGRLPGPAPEPGITLLSHAPEGGETH